MPPPFLQYRPYKIFPIASVLTDFARGACYARGMEIIYIDSLFFLNLLLDYLMLLCAGRLCSLPLARKRIALGALWGAVYAAAAVLLGGFLLHPAVKLASGAVAAVIAYGPGRRALRAIVAFFSVSAGFGGAVYALARLYGGDSGSKLFVPASMPLLLLSFALCYAAVSLVLRRSARRPERRLCRADISLRGREVSFAALCDSGNELTDPLTGRRVLVAEPSALAPLFPGTELTAGDAAELFVRLSGQAPGLRMIPFSSVGSDGSLLLCFTPDAVALDGRRRALSVAISPHGLPADGEYRAIVNDCEL